MWPAAATSRASAQYRHDDRMDRLDVAGQSGRVSRDRKQKRQAGCENERRLPGLGSKGGQVLARG